MKHLKLVCAVLLAVPSLFAQHEVQLKFSCRNAQTEFQQGEVITALNGTNYKVSAMAFYVSRVELVHDGGQVTQVDTNEVFYINFLDPVASLGTYDVESVEGIRFMVGVPEYLNHLDISQYPEGHPLGFHNPSMHWGWAAGYIHFLMNGFGDNNNDGDPTFSYQLNCLGDENVQYVDLATTALTHQDGVKEVMLICNLDQWLRNTDPATTGPVHGSDGVNAMVMSNVSIYPVFVSPQNAAVSELQTIDVRVARKGTEVTVSWDEAIVQSYRLSDASGRVLESGACVSKQLKFDQLPSGVQLLQLYSDAYLPVGSVKWVSP